VNGDNVAVEEEKLDSDVRNIEIQEIDSNADLRHIPKNEFIPQILLDHLADVDFP